MASSASQSDNLLTLTHFLIKEQQKYISITSDLVELINSIQTAIKIIRAAISNTNITTCTGLTGEVNTHGESITRLDEFSNNIFISMLSHLKSIYLLVSEENETMIEIQTLQRGKYIVCFDPLDGSSNIDCLVSVGSIFGIYQIPHEVPKDQIPNVLIGRNLIAAGYAIYGPATMIILSTGHGVNGFSYNAAIGEFILTQPDIKLPKRGKIYSVNEGYEEGWTLGIRNYIHSKKYPSIGKCYGARYVGSMVADVHRTLTYGGIFLYPASKENPNGKLRLLYECIPLSYIVKEAGGKASNGIIDILDVIPEKIHERSPIFLGSKEDVEELLSYIKQN